MNNPLNPNSTLNHNVADLPEKEINTHHLVVTFGKYKGELWTRVPLDYLQWLVNQKETIKGMENNKKMAQAELNRRGTRVRKEVEITPHAIDRASLRCRKIWHETSKEDEGIYTWLSRVASEVIQKKGMNEKVNYLNMKFVFKVGKNYPILKTIYNL